MRQIVAGLTGDAEGSGDLANELSKADPVTLENGQESDDDISEPGDWVPDPVDADPGEMPSPASCFPWWAVALSSSFAGPLELGWAGAGPCSSHSCLLDSTREIELQTPLLRHHQPPGEHLRQQGPVHQRVPHSAG